MCVVRAEIAAIHGNFGTRVPLDPPSQLPCSIGFLALAFPDLFFNNEKTLS